MVRRVLPSSSIDLASIGIVSYSEGWLEVLRRVFVFYTLRHSAKCCSARLPLGRISSSAAPSCFYAGIKPLLRKLYTSRRRTSGVDNMPWCLLWIPGRGFKPAGAEETRGQRGVRRTGEVRRCKKQGGHPRAYVEISLGFRSEVIRSSLAWTYWRS